MNQLEGTVQEILDYVRDELANETWISRRRYFNQLLKLAASNGITEPCQELYDAFIADDNGSAERRSLHIRCVKLLDEASGTHAKDTNGKYFTEERLPNENDVKEFFRDKNFPLNTQTYLSYLIVKSGMEMTYLNLTESTMGQYKHAWLEIRYFCIQHGTAFYKSDILKSYILSNTVKRNSGLIKEWKWKINRKAASVLIEVAETGRFRWAPVSNLQTCPVPSDIEPIQKNYQRSLVDRNLSSSTVNLHDYVFRKFIYFGHISSVDELLNFSPEQICDVVHGLTGICTPRSLSVILPTLRMILKKLFADGFMRRNVSSAIVSANLRKGYTPTYLSQEDEHHLLDHLEYESKRTKAVILLALRLGLRDSDICGLRFDEIDWRHDRLIVMQSKTGIPLVLPLLTDVGNAVMDYIENERPIRKDYYPYVFLRFQAPHNRISSAYMSCSKLIDKLGIVPVNGSCKGIHMFRYSLVHRLLEAHVPHQVITNTLGHTSHESDKPYLSMEDSMLQLCALDLSLIGKITWKEKEV